MAALPYRFADFLTKIRPTRAQLEDYSDGHNRLTDRLKADETLETDRCEHPPAGELPTFHRSEAHRGQPPGRGRDRGDEAEFGRALAAGAP